MSSGARKTACCAYFCAPRRSPPTLNSACAAARCASASCGRPSQTLAQRQRGRGPLALLGLELAPAPRSRRPASRTSCCDSRSYSARRSSRSGASANARAHELRGAPAMSPRSNAACAGRHCTRRAGRCCRSAALTSLRVRASWRSSSWDRARDARRCRGGHGGRRRRSRRRGRARRRAVARMAHCASTTQAARDHLARDARAPRATPRAEALAAACGAGACSRVMAAKARQRRRRRHVDRRRTCGAALDLVGLASARSAVRDGPCVERR